MQCEEGDGFDDVARPCFAVGHRRQAAMRDPKIEVATQLINKVCSPGSGPKGGEFRPVQRGTVQQLDADTELSRLCVELANDPFKLSSNALRLCIREALFQLRDSTLSLQGLPQERQRRSRPRRSDRGDESARFEVQSGTH